MSSAAPTNWIRGLSLRRTVTSNRFLPEVDGFRFLAIVMVVVSHIYVQCAPFPPSGLMSHLFLRAFFDGRHGVYLFFAISGFILALPFARHHLQHTKRVDLRSYFKRRITRLEPPYLIVMIGRGIAIAFFSAAASPGLGLHLLASIFYVHSLVFAHYSTINPPAWSLEVEIQFYILAPLLTVVFMIRSVALRRTVIVLAMLLSAAASTHWINPDGRLGLTILYYFQYFAAGFLLCDLYLTKSDFSIPPLLWDLIGGTALVWILFSQTPWYSVILPFASVALYMAGFYGRAVRAFFSIPAISIIGGMCYSIYLTHSGVLTLVHRLSTQSAIGTWPIAAQNAVIYPLCFAGILAVGTVYFVLIERPCMNAHWPEEFSAWVRNRFTRPAASAKP